MEPTHFSPDESPLPAKVFVVGVSAGGQSKAYPLEQLAGLPDAALEDTVGGIPVRIVVTSPRTAYVDAAPEAKAETMLWFAWKEANPETEVYEAPGTEAADPAAEQEAADETAGAEGTP
jgi:hypothetical protein